MSADLRESLIQFVYDNAKNNEDFFGFDLSG